MMPWPSPSEAPTTDWTGAGLVKEGREGNRPCLLRWRSLSLARTGLFFRNSDVQEQDAFDETRLGKGAEMVVDPGTDTAKSQRFWQIPKDLVDERPGQTRNRADRRASTADDTRITSGRNSEADRLYPTEEGRTPTAG